MKNKIRYVAAVATLAIAGVVVAPVAVAASVPAARHAAPTTSPAPAPPPYGYGGDPLVPSNTGADPYVLLPPGYELPG
jgi:hypothetical protein